MNNTNIAFNQEDGRRRKRKKEKEVINTNISFELERDSNTLSKLENYQFDLFDIIGTKKGSFTYTITYTIKNLYVHGEGTPIKGTFNCDDKKFNTLKVILETLPGTSKDTIPETVYIINFKVDEGSETNIKNIKFSSDVRTSKNDKIPDLLSLFEFDSSFIEGIDSMCENSDLISFKKQSINIKNISNDEIVVTHFKLPNLKTATAAYKNCSSLQDLPTELFEDSIDITDVSSIFSGDKSLNGNINEVFSTELTSTAVNFTAAFAGCALIGGSYRSRNVWCRLVNCLYHWLLSRRNLFL